LTSRTERPIESSSGGRPDVQRHLCDAALRRGARDGLLISALIGIVVVLTNVVFPAGPNVSDGDPEYAAQILAAYVFFAGLLILVGARAQRRSPGRLAGAKAGATAGVVIAMLVTVIFLVVNNAFFAIVSQQHDKRVAFAASGTSSMRAYINTAQIEGGLLLIPALAVVGAALGLLGGMTARRRPRSDAAA